MQCNSTSTSIIYSNDLTYKAKTDDITPETRAFYLINRGYVDKRVDPLNLMQVFERPARK